MESFFRKAALVSTIALATGGCVPNIDALVRESTLILAATQNLPAASHSAGRASINSHPPVPLYTYHVIRSWPHHSLAFTQGIVFHDGVLLESGGLYAASTLMKVAPETGQVLVSKSVPAEYFAEGLTVLNDRVYQLTWSSTGFIYDAKNLRKLGEFSYDTVGWGLTHNDTSLIMSDGTDKIRFINPLTFETEKTIRVAVNGIPLNNLNELEYVKGEIFANIWGTDYIVRIDPHNGRIVGWINLKGLLLKEESCPAADVLNGIAYDEVNDRLVVTGKRWPRYYEIRLFPVSSIS